jgi:hypothetical protein
LSHSYCVFNSDTSAGRWTNNLCFQLPLLVTIAANIHAFVRGIKALRHSPQSVSLPLCLSVAVFRVLDD